ncbi:MAG: class I SAM-dependent rRNA methyltransferase [Steroidobacteraceae bacterium]
MTDSLHTELPQLVLRRHDDKRIRGGHAWVFSNEIDTSVTPLTGVVPGAAVRLLDHRRKFLAHALINPHALICGRVVSTVEQQPFGPELLRARLQRALALRERYIGGAHFRLVYGESDGLPGLVIDRYGDLLVGQISTLAMEQRREMLEQALQELAGIRLLVWKNDGGARALEALPLTMQAVGADLPATVQIVEAGLQFEAPLADGQKTGWFYDQTANRAQLRQFLRPGARVLDVCSYVGGWAVSAMAAGAASAVCVDSSQAALDAAQANAERNGVAIETRRGDAFAVLESLHEEGRQFDVLIVDPPAFIKRRKDLPKGEAAYRKLNQLALNLAADDALLVSCSCSWHLPAEALPVLLQSAANHAGRELRLIAQGGQSPDHPVHPAMPETRYLKALFARVCR